MATIVTREIGATAKGSTLTNAEMDANFINLNAELATKESAVAAPATDATTKYWRGDKSWQTLNKSAVGLANVDNTSDANKPISTATQTALNGKANTAHIHAVADVTGLQPALDGKVDKEPGKGLSTEDYTTSDKAKVAGLGTAAPANVTTSSLDTTAGRVLKVGDFGLGGPTQILSSAQENALGSSSTCSYSTGDESNLQSYSGVLQIGYHMGAYATQISSKMGNSTPVLKVRVLNAGAWGAPVTLLHTNNLAQGVGGSTEYPMSQAATTTALNSKADVNASTTGNAATATKLATARTINGVSFDGTANITVADSTKAPLNGTGTSGTWPINVTGSATVLNWKNYGANHFIIDASNSTAPNGAAINSTNSAIPWTASYPTLMGWNGTDTYGVRVDAARRADSAWSADVSNEASAKWYSARINANTASDNSASVEVRNNGGTGDTGLAAIVFHCSDYYGTKLHLRSDGYFGLGGWSRAAWGWYLDASNNMVAAGNITAYSDPRLKENFKRIEDPMAILSKLDGGTFNWRHGFPHIESKAGKRDYGVLADQVQAVMPEIITNSIDIEGESYLTVSYEKLVPVLIEAVKCLEKRIAELEGK